ncbi:MAG: Mur ligase family protein, partial [Candidatus Saccharimonadales bacterium]
MKIGIVGWGVEGQSAFRYFGPQHEYLIANEEPRDDFPQSSDKIKVQFITARREPGLTGSVKDLSYLDGIEACDKIVCTPTAYKNLESKFPKGDKFWKKVTSDRAIFFENVKTKNIIGVTGSKGKGTTSALISKMLQAAGHKVFLGGNIGQSPLDFIGEVQASDWVVLELANFQLYSLHYSPHIAVGLMITPEHLDWHPNFEEYLAAKANLFRYQKPDDIAIYFADNDYSKQIAGESPGRKIPYFESPGARVRADGMIVIGENEQEIINKTGVKLLGEHNLENICAACTAVFEAVGSLDKAKEVLSSFS